jgi:hypothetical protein
LTIIKGRESPRSDAAMQRDGRKTADRRRLQVERGRRGGLGAAL